MDAYSAMLVGVLVFAVLLAVKVGQGDGKEFSIGKAIGSFILLMLIFGFLFFWLTIAQFTRPH